MIKLLLFRIGEKRYGLSLPSVQTIIKTDSLSGITTIKGFSQTCKINNQKLILYNLNYILGTAQKQQSGSEKIILVNISGQLMGLSVDRLDKVVSISEDQLAYLPAVCQSPASDCFPQVLRYDHSLILILAPQGIEKLEVLMPEESEDEIIDLIDIVEDEFINLVFPTSQISKEDQDDDEDIIELTEIVEEEDDEIIELTQIAEIG